VILNNYSRTALLVDEPGIVVSAAYSFVVLCTILHRQNTAIFYHYQPFFNIFMLKNHFF